MGSDNGTSDGRDGIPVGLLVVVGIVLVIILVIVIYFVITKSVEDEEMAELEDLLGKRQGEKDE